MWWNKYVYRQALRSCRHEDNLSVEIKPVVFDILQLFIMWHFIRRKMIFSLNIFIQQSESIGQQGKPYLKASGNDISHHANFGDF